MRRTNCSTITSLPGIPTSLKDLRIRNCPGLRSRSLKLGRLEVTHDCFEDQPWQPDVQQNPSDQLYHASTTHQSGTIESDGKYSTRSFAYTNACDLARILNTCRPGW